MKVFRKWPKIPRLENEVYHITEKIDGTNACIIIQPYTEENEHFSIWTDFTYIVCAQSRTRLLKPSDDNFGFAQWVQANAEQLIKDLGVGYHFGEWWGKGINRGYNLIDRRFSLFNPNKISEVCFNVPSICSVGAENLINHIVDQKQYLKLRGSEAAPGYMKPEGLVIYAEQAKTYWKVIIDK